MRDIYGQTTFRGYDYVVIGSGSAGSVVAARLAEDSGTRVLLLEAGPSDQHLFIRMPAALGFPLGNDRFNWFMHTEEEPELNHRKIYEARGRVLGGSSSINGMNWVRGNPWDYDNWEALGNKGWSYQDCLPYFKKSESFDQGEDDYRGGSGPMKIETCKAENPLYHAFLEAGQQAGYEQVHDHNGYKQEGVHITQRNVHNGLRWNTSRAYLHENRNRKELHVCDRAQVTKIEYDNKKAVRVHLIWHDQKQVVEIGKELIICAGALNSPHLLMLSGVGDANHLKQHGIPVVSHIPGVGQNLKDHIAAPVQFRATQNVSIAKELSLFGKALLGAQWLFFKKGLGATNFFEVGAFIRTREEVKVPDVQFEFIPLLGEFQHGSVKLENGFQYFFSLMRPTSTGRVWLGSRDPLAHPKFVFNYLSTPEDKRDAIAAVKAIRNVVAQKAWDHLRGEEVTPSAQVQTDEQILATLRETAGTNYHPSSTCRMGHDDMSVVDEQGRVHTLDNVRVVDASIMPEIPSGNLNAPIIMMAEKISDHIRGKHLALDHAVDYYRYA